ncbi:hypothetical protein D9M71_173700 [compost metagenome]
MLSIACTIRMDIQQIGGQQLLQRDTVGLAHGPVAQGLQLCYQQFEVFFSQFRSLLLTP